MSSIGLSPIIQLPAPDSARAVERGFTAGATATPVDSFGGRVETSVVVADDADAECEHDRRSDGDDEVAEADRLPAEVLEDEQEHRFHDIRDGVDRRGDLHRVCQEVAGHEVWRQEEEREEDESSGVRGGSAPRLQSNDLHESRVDDRPARRQDDQEQETEHAACDPDAEGEPERDDQARDQEHLEAFGQQAAENERAAMYG